MSTHNTKSKTKQDPEASTESGAETTDHPYEEICGATNRNGNPCKRPAGWGTPGSGGKRCKFHGGSSTGPKDTAYLEGNDHAQGNSGGRPPESNTNAVVHGGFSDWETAYQRFKTDPDGEAWSRMQDLREMYLETAPESPPNMDHEEREQLIRELATRHVLKQLAQSDVWSEGETSTKNLAEVDADDQEHGRGLVFEDDSGTRKANPAHKAAQRHKQRTFEIGKTLSLWE